MENREQVIEKIKKLLAHSVENGATEAEAVAFALKAQKLIADNDIEEWELGEKADREVVETMTDHFYGRSWRGWLATTIADNFRCASYQRHRQVLGSKRKKAFIVFVGYANDAKAASIVFDHLYNIGDELGRRYRRDHREIPDAYDSYVIGFVKGVQAELEKQCAALMLVRPKEVDDYFDGLELGPARRYRAIYVDERAVEEGKAAGRDAVRARRVGAPDASYQLESA